jgi:hypothetical protein
MWDVKIDVKERGFGDVERTHLAQGRGPEQTLD